MKRLVVVAVLLAIFLPGLSWAQEEGEFELVLLPKKEISDSTSLRIFKDAFFLENVEKVIVIDWDNNGFRVGDFVKVLPAGESFTIGEGFITSQLKALLRSWTLGENEEVVDTLKTVAQFDSSAARAKDPRIAGIYGILAGIRRNYGGPDLKFWGEISPTTTKLKVWGDLQGLKYNPLLPPILPPKPVVAEKPESKKSHPVSKPKVNEEVTQIVQTQLLFYPTRILKWRYGLNLSFWGNGYKCLGFFVRYFVFNNMPSPTFPSWVDIDFLLFHSGMRLYDVYTKYGVLESEEMHWGIALTGMQHGGLYRLAGGVIDVIAPDEDDLWAQKKEYITTLDKSKGKFLQIIILKTIGHWAIRGEVGYEHLRYKAKLWRKEGEGEEDWKKMEEENKSIIRFPTELQLTFPVWKKSVGGVVGVWFPDLRQERQPKLTLGINLLLFSNP